MTGLIVKKVNNDETLPIELLLLADPSEKIVKEYCKRGSIYGAFNGKEIIGVYVLIKTRPETVEIVNVAVKEKYQGKGIGKALVLHAIEVAKEMQMKTIEIGTGNSGIVQLALYQKCGFRIVGVDKDFFALHYDEEIFENGIQCIDMIRLKRNL